MSGKDPSLDSAKPALKAESVLNAKTALNAESADKAKSAGKAEPAGKAGPAPKAKDARKVTQAAATAKAASASRPNAKPALTAKAPPSAPPGPPVFILCAMRSYSSLICAMLGQHPELYGLPEVNLAVADTLGGVVQFYQRRAHGLHGLLRVVAQVQSGVQTDASIAAAQDFVTAHADWPVSRMLDWIDLGTAPRRIVDKSPVTVRSVAMMQRLHAMRPQAQFLHITRHPAAVCRSIDQLHARLDAEQGTSLTSRVDAEQVWFSCNSNIQTFKKSLAPGVCLTLQGEAFLADYALYAPQVCDWLGIGSAASDLAAMLHPETSSYAGFGPDAARYGNDPNFLEHPALDQSRLAGLLDLPGVDQGIDGRALRAPTLKLARELGYF